ncbi:MAG: hypothetical protein AVDCRST_MAG89-2959, partial [uncultured Gemmatimonadetes bacterium]
ARHEHARSGPIARRPQGLGGAACGNPSAADQPDPGVAERRRGRRCRRREQHAKQRFL